jgi:branched-chain amino acid transport system substrate-binding protein
VKLSRWVHQNRPYVRLNSLLITSILITSVTPISLASASQLNVTIAFQGPLSGPEAQTGRDQLDAVKFAVHHFNKRFEGLMNVSVVEVDDQGDPAIASKVVPNVAANSNILGLVGPSYSGASIASLTFYKPANLPMISPSASRLQLTDPTTLGGAIGFPVFHRVVSTEKSIAPALYKIATEGIPNPRVLVVSDVNMPVLSMFLKDGANAQNVVAIDLVSDPTTDWYLTIDKVREYKANVVIYTGYARQATSLFSQLRNSGFTGIIAGTESLRFPSILEFAPTTVLEGVRFVASTVSLASISSDLENNFRQVIGRSSGNYAPESLNATNVLLYCIANGVTTRSQMLACIKSYKGSSLLGQLQSFDVNGDASQPDVYEFEIRSGSYIYKNTTGRPQQNSTEIIGNFPWYSLGSPEVRLAAAAQAEANKNIAAAQAEADKNIAAAKLEAAKILAAAKLTESKAAADKILAEAALEAARILEAAKTAVTKKITISCVKGKLTKKITAVKPLCPVGYKKK